MTPLPSVYKGYHCRSRLEARWLCFLDTLGMQFIYEPEGFKLEDGTCYLPDLYFPVIETWGEIKPTTPPYNSPDGIKIRNLVQESGKPLIILAGHPDFAPYNQAIELEGRVGDWVKYPWRVSLDIHKFRKWYFREQGIAPRLYDFPSYEEVMDCSPQYRAAISASRALRFDSH